MLCCVILLQANEESDESTNVDTSARISRTRMLKELAVTLCKNEQRILFRLQYVSILSFSMYIDILFLSFTHDTEYRYEDEALSEIVNVCFSSFCGCNRYCELICEDFVPYPAQKA